MTGAGLEIDVRMTGTAIRAGHDCVRQVSIRRIAMALGAGVDMLRISHFGKTYWIAMIQFKEIARSMDSVNHIGQVALAIVRGHVVDIVAVVAGFDLGVSATMADITNPGTVAGFARGRGHHVGT